MRTSIGLPAEHNVRRSFLPSSLRRPVPWRLLLVWTVLSGRLVGGMRPGLASPDRHCAAYSFQNILKFPNLMHIKSQKGSPGLLSLAPPAPS